MIGDHGVELMRAFSNREANSGARTYLTWSSWRNVDNQPGRLKVFLITHPWVTYRRAKNLTSRSDARGTLVFISHTLQDTVRSQFDFDKYIASLANLPSEHLPVTLCVPMIDIKKGIHLQLKKYGLPIVTAGNISSPFFVDRFYDLITRFKYCTSNVAGSQMFYSEEIGVPYFLMGEENEETESNGVSVSYYQVCDDDLISTTKRLFAFDNLGPSQERTDFVSAALGLDLDLVPVRKKLRKRLMLDFFALAPFLFSSVTKSAINVLRSLILKLLSKRVATKR